MEQATGSVLERGREAFDQRVWNEAFELLCAADREHSLTADDLARLAESARWSANYDAMFNGYERAEAAYSRAGNRRRAARMAFELTIEHYFRRNEAAMMGWFSRAGSLLADDTECEEHGLLVWCQARMMMDLGKIDEARRLFEEILALAGRVDAPEVEAIARNGLGHVYILEGKVGEGLKLIDESNAAALGGGTQLWTAGMIYCSTIWACRNIGDWRRASEWTDSSIRWCERESVSHFPGLCRFHRAEVLRIRGALDDAERDALAAIEELTAANPRDAPWALGELGEIRRRRGDLDGAARAFRRAVELGFEPQPGLALLRLDEGKPAVALRSIIDALAEEGAFIREGRGYLLPAQLTIAIASGDLELARAALVELEQHAKQSGGSAFRASAACAAGELALAEGDPAGALSALRRGIRNWHDVDAPYEIGQARVALARAYRALGADDDAVMELQVARDTFDRLGARGASDRVAAMLESAAKHEMRAVRTFVFTDIVDSTKLVELLGDDAWENLLAWHDRTLRGCFTAHGGEEVKHEGDGFFVAFADADTALRCAVEVQRTLASHRRDHGFAPQVRIGAHIAEATARRGDYGGRGVHVAARVGAVADGGEIVASRETLLAAGREFQTSDIRALELKGLSAPVDVATIAWRE